MDFVCGHYKQFFPHNWENVKLIRGERARGCDMLGTTITPGGSGTNQTAVGGVIYHTQHHVAVDQKPFFYRLILLGTWVRSES